MTSTGGHDPRIPENVHTHVSLQELASSLKLSHDTYRSNDFHPSKVSQDTQILFLLSVPDSLKNSLLASATLLIYTPQNEHFGIVPLEAMLATVPVLAANEGGPVETVVEGKTGWLRDIRRPDQWTEIILKVLDFSRGDNGRRLLANMGQSGRERVIAIFSKESMAKRIDESLDELANTPRLLQAASGKKTSSWVWVAVWATLFAVAFGWGLTELLFFLLEKNGSMDAARLAKNAVSVTPSSVSSAISTGASIISSAAASAREEL